LSGSNCLEDLDQVLILICNDLITNQINRLIVSEDQNDLFNFKPIKKGTVDYYSKLNIPERNAYRYVCGYIRKKYMVKHVCQIYRDYAIN